MRADKKYKIKNGNVTLTNSQVKVDYNFSTYVWNIIKFFAAIGLMVRFKSKIEDLDNINGFYENAKLIIIGLASLTLFYFFIEFIFKRIWKNTIEIENLEKVEIYNFNKREDKVDDDVKIELELISNNGRSKELKFYKIDNTINDFIEELRKRNTKIKVEY